jgi:ABC-type transport system substrate-binding protein/class 3 adenylate cyclase
VSRSGRRQGVPNDDTIQPETRASGLRTFLIADVRGYTTYTREHGDEAGAELAATFAATVREVVEAREGVLLELRGDEALVVFESPRQAVRAAVAVQQRLQEVGLARGVGIGLDAGEAVQVEGGFRGAALNLAARLCSQAKAGEVLATEALTHLTGRVDGVAYVEPRLLHAKGYVAPIRALEVVPADRVPSALAARVRGTRRAFVRHRRTILAGAVAVGAAGLAVVLITRQTSPPPASPNQLAALEPGVAIIDAETDAVINQIPRSTIKTPVELWYAAGKFWVLNLEPSSLVEIDARTGAIGRTVSPSLPCCGGVAIDGDTMWMTDFERPIIAKIHIPSGREVDRFDLADQLDEPSPDGFSSIVAADGSLWLAGKNRAQIFRVNPVNGKLQATIDHVFGSWTVAAGDGAVWGSSFGGVDRIDTRTNTALKTDVSAGIGVGGYVTTGGGFAWTANESKGELYEIDQAGKVAATFETGLGARGVSFADGSIWVANQDEGTVSRVDVVTGAVTNLEFAHPVQVVAAGSGSVAVVLAPGRSYEDRIQALQGTVARLFIEGYQFDQGDSANTWTPVSTMVEQATCARLLRFTPDGGLEPEVAAMMPSVSDDGRTYTFTVRPGFAFSGPDAEAVTAETFRFSIERALSPRLQEGAFAPGPDVLPDLAGEKAFRAGTAEHISGLVADGDTLTITLTQPSGEFLPRLSLPFFCPVPLDTPVLPGAAARDADTEDRDVDMIPSAGPYYVAEYLQGEYINLKRNPNYGGDRTAAFDAIALREGINGGVAVSRVEDESWDGVLTVYDRVFDPAGELATRWGPNSEPAAGGDQRYYAVPDGGVLGVVFNASRPPFSDVRLRQAVSVALDREALARAFSGQFIATLPWDSALSSSWGPPGARAEVPQPDLATARRLARPHAGAELRLVLGADCEECRRAANSIADQLAQIGLTVRMDGVDDPIAEALRPDTPYDFLLGASWPAAPDAAIFVDDMLLTDLPAPWLPDDLVSDARHLRTLSGADRRTAAVSLVANHFGNRYPVAIFANSVAGAFFNPTIGCLSFDSQGTLDLVALCRGEAPTPSATAGSPTP